MNRLKKTQLEAEQLKKITVEAQFEALRNQINPHFLFNCFNVLSTLVYKDADTSAKFISQLSNVYRYLLYNQQRKVVPLAEELSFIESYLFLLQIRFGENINVKVAVSEDAEKLFVAPAVLQMLIENAIKHNVISKKNPLAISVFSDTSGITVINSLHLKPNPEESSHLGLNNIRQRYAFLSEQPIQIIKSDTDFTVKIPLLAISES